MEVYVYRPLRACDAVIVATNVSAGTRRRVYATFQEFCRHFQATGAARYDDAFIRPRLDTGEVRTCRLNVKLRLRDFNGTVPTLKRVSVVMLIGDLLSNLHVVHFPVSLYARFTRVRPYYRYERYESIRRLNGQRLLCQFGVGRHFVFQRVRRIVRLRTIIM